MQYKPSECLIRNIRCFLEFMLLLHFTFCLGAFCFSVSHYTELRGEKYMLILFMACLSVFCFTVKCAPTSLTLLFSISQSVFQKEAACFLFKMKNYNRLHV